MNTSIPVFLSSDDNYAPFVAVAIASACVNTKAFLDFYILDDGITEENQKRIRELHTDFCNFSIEFIKTNTPETFAGFRTHGHCSIATYSRFLIPDLKPDIDKAIYSDVDVIFTGDIAQMFSTELGEFALGAIPLGGRYACSFENLMNKQRREAMELSSEHKYFNAGNLLIDCKKWRDRNITKKLLKIEKEYRFRHQSADQDVLNKYFDNSFLPLDERFCLINQDCYYFSKYAPDLYEDLKKGLIIRHFNGPVKPWHYHICTNADFENSTPQPIAHFDDFWHFAKMTPFYTSLHADYIAARAKYRGMMLAFSTIRKKQLEEVHHEKNNKHA